MTESAIIAKNYNGGQCDIMFARVMPSKSGYQLDIQLLRSIHALGVLPSMQNDTLVDSIFGIVSCSTHGCQSDTQWPNGS
jgi:hypothetical protein